jgi:hypothetical protein
MMPRQLPARLGPLAVAVAVAACSFQPAPPEDLSARLQERLSPEIQANQANVQQLPDGAQVLLQRDLLFRSGGPELDDRGRYVLGSVVQGLLDLRIMEIAVQSDPSRAEAVKDFFETTLRASAPDTVANTPPVVVGDGAGAGTPAAGSVIVRVRVVPVRQASNKREA